jgi:hypothetical protein
MTYQCKDCRWIDTTERMCTANGREHVDGVWTWPRAEGKDPMCACFEMGQGAAHQPSERSEVPKDSPPHLDEVHKRAYELLKLAGEHRVDGVRRLSPAAATRNQVSYGFDWGPMYLRFSEESGDVTIQGGGGADDKINVYNTEEGWVLGAGPWTTAFEEALDEITRRIDKVKRGRTERARKALEAMHIVAAEETTDEI